MSSRRHSSHDSANLRRYVEVMAGEHPPLSLEAADLTIKDPVAVRERYGAVFNYLTRVELEVERNVLELRALMPRPTEIDRHFYADVWSPQEIQHGILLDAVQKQLGLAPSPADLIGVSTKIKLAGLLSHLPGMRDVIRLLYYLTGVTTERAAIVAYARLVDGLRAMTEYAIAETIVAPIRRQEPGHFAFYRMSAESLVKSGAMRPWQLYLTRVLRQRSFGLVGANNTEQQAAFGGVARSLGLDQDLLATARQISLVERELLWARRDGMYVPDYVVRALDEAIALHSTAAG